MKRLLFQIMGVPRMCWQHFMPVDLFLIAVVGVSLTGWAISGSVLSKERLGIFLALGLLGFIVLILQIFYFRRLEALINKVSRNVDSIRKAASQDVGLIGGSDICSKPLLSTVAPSTHKEGRSDVLIVAAVRDREEHRLRNLLRSLRAQDYDRTLIHITIVDYCSAPEMGRRYRELCLDAGAVYIRVNNRPIWRRSEALNIGARGARTRYILFADTDLIYQGNYITEMVRALDEDAHRIVHSAVLETGEGRVSRDTDILDEYQDLRRHARCRGVGMPESGYIYGLGVCGMSTTFFASIRGFDEFYSGWGCEDDDLIKRLQAVGLYLYDISEFTSYLHDSHRQYMGLFSAEVAQVEANKRYYARARAVRRNERGWGIPSDAMMVPECDGSRPGAYRLEERPLFISVIVPAFDDAELLEACLRALEAQTLDAKEFEVIVVDNSEDGRMREVVSRHPMVRYVTENAVPGSYAARNVGMSVARGDILAFTDDDCRPRPDWLEKGRAYFFGTRASYYVGGRIQLYCRDDASPTAPEMHEILFGFNQERNVRNYRYAATANLFIKRSILERVGDFEGGLKSGGDREFGQRVKAAGFGQFYAEEVVVQHPAARSLKELVRRQARYVGGDFDRRKPEERGRLGALVRDLRNEVRLGGNLAGRALKGSNISSISLRIELVRVVMWVRLVRMMEWIRLYGGGVSTRD